jgi:iron(III) transport system permease protein
VADRATIARGARPRAPRRVPWSQSAWGLALAAFLLLIAWPVYELLAAALDEGLSGAVRTLRRPGAARAAANTLWTGALVTPIAVTGGLAAALVTERSTAPGRDSMRLGLLLTLLVPGFVAAESWAQAYGPAGLTDRLLGWSLPGTFGAPGVVTVLVVTNLPLAYLVVVAGLASRVEPDLERAARASGASAWQAFRTVTLPLLRPTILAASALVFVFTINAFGVPAFLGLPGGFVTVTTQIYRDLVLSADPEAFTRVLVLASALMAIAFVAASLGDTSGALRAPATRTGGPSGGAVSRERRGWLLTAAVCAYLATAVVLPLVALLLRALTRAVGLPPVPANWTLRHFDRALTARTSEALWNSLILAGTAATIVVLLGALLIALRGRRARTGLGTATVLTFAVPGSALAVAVLLAYGARLRDTLLLILVAYLAKFWALGHRSIVGSAEALPPDLPHAARVSGAGALTTLRTVTIPLLSPALLAGWLLVFITAVQELTMSALLYGPGSATLAVVILNARQLGQVTTVAALAVLLTALVLLAVIPFLLLLRRRSAR